MAPALIEVRLRQPVAYRLRGWLELLRQLVGTASRSHQLDHSPPVLRRIPCMALGHRGSPSLSPLRHCPRNRVDEGIGPSRSSLRYGPQQTAGSLRTTPQSKTEDGPRQSYYVGLDVHSRET